MPLDKEFFSIYQLRLFCARILTESGLQMRVVVKALHHRNGTTPHARSSYHVPSHPSVVCVGLGKKFYLLYYFPTSGSGEAVLSFFVVLVWFLGPVCVLL